MTKRADNESLTGSSGAKSKQGIQVIARAATILRALENEKEGLSLGEIAKRVNLPRSTVQRIVNALAEENILIAATLNARVKLGPALLRLAANSSFDFSSFVRPHLDSLARQTGETVDLSMHQGDKMVFVDQIPGSHRLRAMSAVGDSFLMYSSANGKAALSLMLDDEIRKLYGRRLEKETEQTISDTNSLIEEVHLIRESNIAVDQEEHTEGICAVGTAFRDPTDRIFAVSVPVPTVRFIRHKDSIVDALKEFRERLMEALAA